MSNKTALLKYWLAMALVLILGLSWGCATRSNGTPGTDAAEPSSSANASLAAPDQEEGDQEEVQQTDKQAKKIRIDSADGATRLRLPIARSVNVDTQYEDSRLTLSCAPALPGPITHETVSGEVLESIDFSTIPETDRIQEIAIQLEQHANYSLSRMDADTMELVLATPDADEAAASDQQGVRRLRDINFYETEEGGLKIVLTGGESLEYKLRPSENNELNLALPGTRIPAPQTKLYNLDKFQSPVQKALLSNSPSGGRVQLTMTHRIPVKIRRKDKDLVLSVAAQKKKTAETTQVEMEDASSDTAEQAEEEPEQQPASPGNETIAQFQNTLGDGLIVPGMQDRYTGKPISIDVQNAELSHVLRLLSDVGAFNLVMDEGVSGTITLKLDEVPWDQVMDNVLRQKGLGIKKVGNRILRIAPIDKLRQEQQRNIQVRKSAKEAEQSKEDLAPLSTEYIQINYSDAQSLQSQVQKFLSDRGQVSHDPRTNQLIVSDTEGSLNKVKSVVNKLDQAERQVLIEARIVYATENFTENLGLQWGGNYANADGPAGVYGTGGTTAQPGYFTGTTQSDTPSGQVLSGGGSAPQVGPSPGYAVNLLPQQGAATLGIGGFLSKVTGSDLYALDAQLQIGESENQVKTVSKPKVVTLNNQEAAVEQGTMLATQSESESGGTTTEYTEATLNLTVTPQITPDNKLIMEIQISDDSPVGGGGDDIETRSVETKLIVDNGNTIVIGGVQELSQTESQQSVPGVSNLPILGWLFKNKYTQEAKRELLVFIRPKIL
ncbi:MAG: type IV pilus secretin PilQ [Desulfohalobiaceae bacterium]